MCGIFGFEKAVLPHSAREHTHNSENKSHATCVSESLWSHVYLNCTICKTLISRRYTYTSANVILIMLCSPSPVCRCCALCRQCWLRYQPIVIFESTCTVHDDTGADSAEVRECVPHIPQSICAGHCASIMLCARRGKMQHTIFRTNALAHVVFFPLMRRCLRFFFFASRTISYAKELIETKLATLTHIFISLNGSHRSIDRIITLFSRNCNFKSVLTIRAWIALCVRQMAKQRQRDKHSRAHFCAQRCVQINLKLTTIRQ